MGKAKEEIVGGDGHCDICGLHYADGLQQMYDAMLCASCLPVLRWYDTENDRSSAALEKGIEQWQKMV